MPPIRLTADQRKALMASEKQIKDAEMEIARAKKIGLDVTEAEATVKEARRLRGALLQEYGGTQTT